VHHIISKFTEESIAKMKLFTGDVRNKTVFKQIKNGAGTTVPALRFILPLPAYF
jgi:hypothetical protein